MQQLRMQQVRTERNCAQGGKACAHKAGARLAALALAMAMVFTTALPAYAEDDLGELDALGGTSSGETVPGTDPDDDPTPQGTSPDGAAETDGAAGNGTPPESSAAPGGQQPAETSPDGGNTAAPDPDGNAANSEQAPGNGVPEPEIMLTALSPDQFTVTARRVDSGTGYPAKVEITITNSGSDLTGSSGNAPDIRIVCRDSWKFDRTADVDGAGYPYEFPDELNALTPAVTWGDTHNEHLDTQVTITAAVPNQLFMRRGSSIRFYATLEKESSAGYSISIRLHRFADHGNDDLDFSFRLSAEPERTVQLTYHANYAGDDGKTAVANPIVREDKVSLFTVTQATDAGIQQPGMVLSQWCVDADGTGAKYAPGDAFPVPADMKQTDLYALWEPAPTGDYRITYHFIDPKTGEYTEEVAYSETPSFTLRSAEGVGTPDLGSTLNGRQVVGWHTVESSDTQNMTVDQTGKLELETYKDGKAKHSSNFDALTGFAPGNGSYGVCGETVELADGTKDIDLYPVLGPAFGYTLTIATGDFPKAPVPGTERYVKDDLYTLEDDSHTVVMANGYTSAAHAPKYVLFAPTYPAGTDSFRKDALITTTTAIPKDSSKRYTFVGWYDKNAHKNKNEANTIVLPGEDAIFGNTANVYSLDAVWFDMGVEGGHYVYDGTTTHAVTLDREPELRGTQDFGATNPIKDVTVKPESYAFSVRYKKPDDPDTAFEEIVSTTKKGSFDAIPQYMDAGVYEYTVTVDVLIRVDAADQSKPYYGEVPVNGYITKTFSTTATMTIDPVDLLISHTSTRYLVGTSVSVEFNAGHNTDEGTRAPVEAPGLLGGDKLTAFTTQATGTHIGVFPADTVPDADIEIEHPNAEHHPKGVEAAQNYRIRQAVQLRILDADVVSIRVPLTKTLSVAGVYSGAVLPAGSYAFAFESTLTGTGDGGTEDDTFADTVSAALRVPADRTDPVSSGTLYASFSFTKIGTYTYTLAEKADDMALPAGVDAGRITNTTSAAPYTLTFHVTGTIDRAALSVTVDDGTGAVAIPSFTDTPVSGGHHHLTGDYNKVLAFENEYDPPVGDLILSKAVVPADTTTPFTFTVTAPVSGLGNVCPGVDFGSGRTAVVTLSGGKSLTLSNIPVGRYTIYETTSAGYNVSTAVQVDGGDAVNGAGPRVTAGVTADGPTTVTYTNTMPTGSLTVRKTVEPAGAVTPAEDTFTFTVTLDDTSLSGDYGEMHFTGGKATVTLHRDESVTAEGLPAGTRYTVGEADKRHYFQTNTEPMEGTIDEDGDTKLTFVNRTAGDLTVQKNVVNRPAGMAAETYHFTVQLTGSDFTGDRTLDGGGTVHFTGGGADVTITGRGSVTINDLPAGAGYTVTEVPASGAKYTAYVGSVQTCKATGTIPDGGTVTAAFTNVYPGTATQTLQLHKQLSVKTNATYNDTGSTLPAEDFAFPFHVRLTDVTDGTAADVSVNGTSFADAGTAGVPVEAKLPLYGTTTTDTAMQDLDLAFTFTAAGTYTFAVSEDDAAQSGASYTVAPADAAHTVSVTYTVTMDASTGALTAVQEGSVTGDTTFVNDLTYNYDPKGVEQTLYLQKLLQAEPGRNLPEGGAYSFTFKVEPVTGTDAAVSQLSTPQITVDHGPFAARLSSVRSARRPVTVTLQAPGHYQFTVKEDTFGYTDIERTSPDEAGYTVTYDVTCRNGIWEVTPGIAPDAADGVLLFTNTCRTGSLTVRKTVQPAGTAPAGDAFAFTVTLTDPAGKELPGRYPYDGDRSGTIASGEQLHLSDGQSVTIKGLPIGTLYSVTEDPVYQYKAEYGTLDGEIEGYIDPAEAAFVNTYENTGWPANDVTVTLAKTVTGPGTMPPNHGSFVIGMLYSWQDDVYSSRQPSNYTMIEVPVSLTLHSARSIPDNNGAGYAFSFKLKTETEDELRLGTGKWLLSVPASAFAGNTGEVTVTGKIPVWVKNDEAASYTFTVIEDDAGENATYHTDPHSYTVNVTVGGTSDPTWSVGTVPKPTLTFTNEYVGPAAPTPPAGSPGTAPAGTAPTFGYYRLITLSYSTDPTQSYRQTVGLPVGDSGTTVHLFEVPTDHYVYEDSAFTLGAVTDVQFMNSSEGGVLTIPASARTAGGSVNIGTVTFTNRYIPVPAEMRVQTQSTLTAIGDGATLPADTYTFTYTLTGAVPVSGSAPGSRAANQTLSASETALSTDTSITAISAGFAVYSFAEPGDYTFTATQDKGSKPGVTYDEVPQTVTVSVGYDSLSNLEVKKVLVDGEDAPDNGRGATLLTFNNTYQTPPPPPPPDEPKEEPDDTPDKPAARTAAPVPTPAPVAVRVPRTADDMPLGAVWALFGAAAAALAVLGTVWHRRRKNR